MDGFPELDSDMLDLLVVWEERKASGNPAMPEDLCRGCPERLDELRRYVEQIVGLDPVLALTCPGEVERPTIPGFELLGEIGRGGMGVVYRAQDLSLDRVVAVKVPFGGAGGALSRSRFEREGRTLAKLRHPGIVPVHAAGFAGNAPYFVMEHVGGGNLAARMGEVAGAPGQVAELVRQVALAVDHAHATGIVHRDLKPSNILLDEAGRPFVSDFGVAALLAGGSLSNPASDTPADRGHEQTCITLTGAGVGTPAYTAPELRPGRPGKPSAASDVWSLGVVLYECLTSRLPYPDLEETGTAGAEPSPPRSIRPKIPRGLEAVVMRCLAVDPAERYPTAAALAKDLGRYADGRARWARWARLSTVVVVGVVVGIWGEFRQREGPRHQAVATSPQHDPVAEQGRVNERLAVGGEYVYEGFEPHTGPFRPLVGGRSVPQRSPDGDGLSVTAAGMELVELRPDLPCEQYEFTAQVRVDHAAPVGASRAGLYFCFRCAPPAQNPEPWAAYSVTFAERGSEAATRPTKGQDPGSRVRVGGWVGVDRAARGPMGVDIGFGPRYQPSVSDGGTGPWRELGVRVGSEGVAVLWRENGVWESGRPLSVAHCSKSLALAIATSPRWAALPLGFHARGGIGVYAHDCRATFRRVTVRPLRDGREP